MPKVKKLFSNAQSKLYGACGAGAALIMSSSAHAYDPATDNWFDVWMADAKAGFDEHSIAIVSIGGLLLVAGIFRNSILSGLSMLSTLGRR